MEYIKLIVVDVGDFSSSILLENNYGTYEIDMVNRLISEMESKGYVCIMLKVCSDIIIKL